MCVGQGCGRGNPVAGIECRGAGAPDVCGSFFCEAGMYLFGASFDFNISCFCMKNVLSLHYGSAGTA